MRNTPWSDAEVRLCDVDRAITDLHNDLHRQGHTDPDLDAMFSEAGALVDELVDRVQRLHFAAIEADGR